MKMPHELMSKNYSGPSKLLPLSTIENRVGFRFIGIDKDGGSHYCIVRKGINNNYYINSNTVAYNDLCGWIPDTKEKITERT